jgi:hypothetical protein
MLARCPHSPQRGTGWLEGWRLTFGGEDIGWDGALTTVVEDPAQRVFLVLYDVPEIDERELDTWDGVTLGYYRKLKVRVQTLDGDVLAWLYVLDAYEGGLPSARHVSILVDAAIKAGAPDDYVQWLQSRPCNPPSVTPGPILEIPDEPPTFLSACPIRLTPSSKSSAPQRAAISKAAAGSTIAATDGQCQREAGGCALSACARPASARPASAITTRSALMPKGPALPAELDRAAPGPAAGGPPPWAPVARHAARRPGAPGSG